MCELCVNIILLNPLNSGLWIINGALSENGKGKAIFGEIFG